MAKPVVKCRLFHLEERKSEGCVWVAYLIRLSEHPRLGPPNDKMMRTSIVERIDFKLKKLETLNTIYDWS